MGKFKKLILSLVCISLAGFIFASPVSALEWNGASSGGGGGTIDATGGYAVEFTSKKAVGYRFSVVNENGRAYGNAVDIFRKSTGSGYISLNKFSNKFNKYDLIQIYNKKAFSLTSGNTDSDDNYYDTSLGITLPEYTDGMEDWQNTTTNLDYVLKKIQSGLTTKSLYYGGRVRLRRDDPEPPLGNPFR